MESAMAMTPDEYLKTRVDDQIRWYGENSGWNQRTYKRLRTLEIVLAASIPFLVGYAGDLPWVKLATGTAGVAVAVIAGLFSLYRFHENWISYRATGETLKREKVRYLCGSPPYDGPNAFHELVARCEGAIASENDSWKTLFGANPQAAEPPSGSPITPNA